MTGYEKSKQAMLKLAVKKKLLKRNYTLIACDYILKDTIIDYIALDEKKDDIVFIKILKRDKPEFKDRKKIKKEIDKDSLEDAISWYKRSQELTELESRLDIVEGYVGTKKVRIKYYNNILADSQNQKALN